MNLSFLFFEIKDRKSIVTGSRNCQVVFQTGCIVLYSESALYQGSSFSVSSPAFGIITTYYYSH